MNTNLLKRNFNIQKPSFKDWWKMALLFILPNLGMWALAYGMNISRPIINVDYFVSFVLLLIPNRWSRLLGMIALFIALIFDVLMLVVQIFPFLDLSAIRYLLPFIAIAPKSYIHLFVGGLIYFILLSFVLWRISAKTRITFYPVLLLAIFALLIHETTTLKYHSFPSGILGRDNYYYGHSQVYLYHEMTKSSFVRWGNTTPVLSAYPNHKQAASTRLNQNPPAQKILFIVAESWGVARKPEAQRMILQNIYQQQNHFEWINEGYFDFSGSTVQGELRELCQMAVQNGYALSRLDKTQFASCLPEKLRQQNYVTIAMHGTSGRLYDRYDWYQKAGFMQTIFGENLLEKKRCTAFNGVCDSELPQVVLDKFKQHQNDKIFFYWLTLTSHAPFSKEDINGVARFDCTRFGMNPNGDICRNAQLETQFFDNLANILNQPEMRGTEVMIVGDHMPPLFGMEEIHPFIRWQDVSWVHFKIKNQSN